MNVFTDKRFITNLKTEKVCDVCKENMDIGTEVEFLQTYYSYKHFKISHVKCALKIWKQRLQENINADAPQIVIDKFKEIIAEFKKI